MPDVQIADNEQRQLVGMLLALKIAQLDKLRGVLVDLVAHGKIPAEEALGPIQRIAEETISCQTALVQVNTTVIGFPTPEQIAALQAAVQGVTEVTIDNANLVAVAHAAGDLVATFPA